MKWIKIVFLTCWWSVWIFGQLNENFSDGNFTNMPVWQGDDSVFTIHSDNGNFQLQSNKLQTNTSFYLATASNLSQNCQWEWYTKLAFNTSSANYTDFFLTASASDLLASGTTGYVLRIGGTTDEISLYKKEATNWTKLIDGIDGTTNGTLHTLKIKVICTLAGYWQLFVDTSGTGSNYQLWGAVTDNSISGSLYAGWAITQSTASFFQKHFLDEVYIGPIVYDTIPPQVTQIQAISANQLDVVFNEAIEQVSAQIVANYTLNSGTVVYNAILDPIQANRVHLNTSALTNGENYLLTLQTLADTSGNAMNTQVIPFTVLFAEQAALGDVIINEILSDPVADGVDFIECFNRSEKIFNLKDWYLLKEDAGIVVDSVLLSTDYFLLPGSYVVLTSDTNRVKTDYWNHAEGTYLQLDLPTYANDSGTISLRSDMQVLDRVSYSSDWQFTLLNDTEGISLERINPYGPTQDPSNWHSAAESKGFGSPGLQNSQYQQVAAKGELHLASETISPDNDGFEDVLQVAYTLPIEGMIGKARVYTDQGRPIATIFEQQLMGTTGNFSWDGISDDSTKVPIGIYILVVEAFSIDGKNMFTKTQAFSVAGKL